MSNQSTNSEYLIQDMQEITLSRLFNKQDYTDTHILTKKAAISMALENQSNIDA